MPLYYITGISGAGKSTVLTELERRGYTAHDVDEAGPVTAKWHNDTTGYIHPKSSVKKEARTPKFLAEHSWKISRDEVAEFGRTAAGNTAFLGGAITNEQDIQDLIRVFFALIIDDNTLKKRLTERTNNDWGKSSHELAYSLQVNHELTDRYAQRGYVVIDASQPIDKIVADILRYIHENDD